MNGWHLEKVCCNCKEPIVGDFNTYHKRQRIRCRVCPVCSTINDVHSVGIEKIRNAKKRGLPSSEKLQIAVQEERKHRTALMVLRIREQEKLKVS